MSSINENDTISNTRSNAEPVSSTTSSNQIDSHFNPDSYEYPLYLNYPTKVEEPVHDSTSAPDSAPGSLMSSHVDLFDCPSYTDSKFVQPLQPLSQSEFEMFEDSEPKLYQELNPISKNQSEVEDFKTYQDLDSPGGSRMQAAKSNDPSHYANSKLYQQLQQPAVRPQFNSESIENGQGQTQISTQLSQNNQNNFYNLHSTHNELKWQNRTSQNMRPLRLPSQTYVANNQYSSKLEISLSHGDDRQKNKLTDCYGQDNYSRVIKQNFQSIAKSGNALTLPTSPVCYGDLGASIRSKFHEKFQNIREVPENKEIKQQTPSATSHRPKQIYYPHETLQTVHCRRPNSKDGISFTFNERTGNYNLTSKFSEDCEERSYNNTFHNLQHQSSMTKSHPVVNGTVVPDRLPSQRPYQYTPVPSSSISNEPLTWEFNHNTHMKTNETDANINKQGTSSSVQNTTNQMWKKECRQSKKHIIKSSLKNKISKLGNPNENPLTMENVVSPNSVSTVLHKEISIKSTASISEPKPGKRKYVRSGKYIGRYKEYYIKQKHSITDVSNPGNTQNLQEMPQEAADKSTVIKNNKNTSILNDSPAVSEIKSKHRKITCPDSEENTKDNKLIIKSADKNVKKRRGRPKKCNPISEVSSPRNLDEYRDILDKASDKNLHQNPEEGFKNKVKTKRGRPRKTVATKSDSVVVENKFCNRETQEDKIPLRKYPRRKLKPKKFDSDLEIDDETDEDTFISYKPRKYKRRRLDKTSGNNRRGKNLKSMPQNTKILKFVDPLKEGLISDEDDVFHGFDIADDKNETVSGLDVKEEIDEVNNGETSSKLDMKLTDNNKFEEVDTVKSSDSVSVEIEPTSVRDQNEETDKLKKEKPEIYLRENCDSGNLLNSEGSLEVNSTCADHDKTNLQVSYSHSCSKCSTSFTSLELLEKHFKWAHERFSCPMCGEHFTSYYFIRKHIGKEHHKDQKNSEKEQHFNDVTASCDECSSTFYSAKALKSHKAKAHKTAADRSLNNGAELVDNNTNDMLCQEEDVIFFSCKMCSSAFSSIKALRMHKFKSHKITSNRQKNETLPSQDHEHSFGHQDKQEGCINIDKGENLEISFSCGDCTSAFSTERALKMHKFKAHKKNLYRCGKCLKRFDQLNLLTAHKRACLSEDGQTLACAYCSETFTSRKLLHEHWSVHLHERVFKCDFCEHQFTTSNALRRHKLMHTCERIFRCEICQKSFPTLDILKEHIKAHTEATVFDCNLCDKSFDCDDSLNAHKRVHLIEKRFECNECSKTFKWKHALKSHKKTHHVEDHYICEKCGKSFSNLDAFKKHSFVHSNELNCQLCFKSFSKYETLKTHMLSHTGTKPFFCDVCNKAFRHKVHLKAHLKSHQKDKLWPCKFCDKFFKSQKHLRRHKRVVHCRAFYEKILSYHTLQDCNEITSDENKESESERQESISLGYNSQSDESDETSPGHLMTYLAEEASSANLSGHDV